MNRPIRIEPEAPTEIDEASRWYDDKRPGLGMEFLDAIDVALSHIARWPRAGAPVPGVAEDLPVRRVPAGRFPYFGFRTDVLTSKRHNVILMNDAKPQACYRLLRPELA